MFQEKIALLLTWFFLCGVQHVQCQEDIITGDTFGSLFGGKCSSCPRRCFLSLGYPMYEGIQGDESCSEKCVFFPFIRPDLTCGTCEIPTTSTFGVGFETKEQLKAAVEVYLNCPDDDASSVAVLYGFPIGNWDVSQITDMSNLFEISTFNGDISSWNTSSVTDMSYMFAAAVTVNGDISSWDTSSVTDMAYMFRFATSFSQNLCSWGSRLPSNASVRNMFSQSGCPNTSDPVLPGGPFCYSCP